MKDRKVPKKLGSFIVALEPARWSIRESSQVVGGGAKGLGEAKIEILESPKFSARTYDDAQSVLQ